MVCSVCGDEKIQEEPALGHDYAQTDRAEPSGDGTAGYIEYTCSRCGDKKRESL